jgi:glucose/mannose-6-phosphate isomerase
MTPGLEPPFAHDAGNMGALLEKIPEQIEDALARVKSHPWRLSIRMPSVLVVGAMGGSAIAADLTAGLYADRTPRPLVTVRNYHLPAFATREAFTLLSSYSGATEETLALYGEARRRQLPRAGLTTGGALAQACDRDGVPWHKLPGGMPPRAALYSSWVPLTMLCSALDWCDDPNTDWHEAARRVRELQRQIGAGVPEEKNPAKQLAHALLGRAVFVYAAQGRSGAAALRLRQQLNENAKLLAHLALVPELNHNEIVGWERPEPFHRNSALIVVSDTDDGPEIVRRLELTADYASTQGAQVHVLAPWPGGRLARLVQHVVFGDYVSFYLALARGVDPSPVASIDLFKKRMAEAGSKRGS